MKTHRGNISLAKLKIKKDLYIKKKKELATATTKRHTQKTVLRFSQKRSSSKVLLLTFITSKKENKTETFPDFTVGKF